jgi:hypothetical protein
VQPYFRPGELDAMFKFAFVRNPFDRFVSYCSFMTRDRDVFSKTPQAVMRHYIENPAHQHILFQPQHSFVADAAGNLLTDYVGRVERMQQSYDEVCERIGIPTAELEKVNATKRQDYRQYYDDSLIAGVAGLYARDLELFGYEF